MILDFFWAYKSSTIKLWHSKNVPWLEDKVFITLTTCKQKKYQNKFHASTSASYNFYLSHASSKKQLAMSRYLDFEATFWLQKIREHSSDKDNVFLILKRTFSFFFYLQNTKRQNQVHMYAVYSFPIPLQNLT